MPPEIQMDKCDRCNVCVDICPEDVFRATREGPVVRYPDECWYCGSCVQDCHLDVITIIFPAAIRLAVLKGGKEQ